MKDNDSYPPSANRNGSIVQCDNLAVEMSDDSEVPSAESDDVRLSGSDNKQDENKIVADDEIEEYEDENTGIKISYKLTPEEVYGVITRSGSFQDNLKAQQKHTWLQAAVLGVIIALVFVIKQPMYLWLALLPVLTAASVWIVPYLGMRKILSGAFNNKPITLEVFPDEIDINQGNISRKIILDDSYESEENDDIIVVTKNNVIQLMLPLRAVEPEFRAEVQAIILAGIKPKEEE